MALFSFTSQKIWAEDKMSIEIIPFGDIEILVLDYLKENLGKIFAAEVFIGKAQRGYPEYAYNKKRGQYLSPAILGKLKKPQRQKRQVILAIINKDLYVPELNFVFGEADIANGVCIISLTRLSQSYYGLPEDRDLFLLRTLKEAVHEIGHLLNLGHCPEPKCVMHFSNSLLDTDIKDYRFCKGCKKSLQQLPY